MEVLPLIAEEESESGPGWCTYTYKYANAPELEVVCGGINHKTSKASAIWRQGHLMHFGFEPSPDQLNANGRALLINSICYIAKFKEDRPIVRPPSVFYSAVRYFDRDTIRRLLDNKSRDLKKYLPYCLSADLLEQTEQLDRAGVRKWFDEVRPYMYPDDEGKLAIDPLARKLKVAPSEPEFFDSLLNLLGGSEKEAQAAHALLARYVPDRPRNEPDESLRNWHNQNKDYLFFSESDGYRWHIDRLARSRGVPSTELRGSDRATHVDLDDPTSTKPVVAGMSIFPSTARPGDDVQVFVRIKIADGWHVYSLDQDASIGFATELDLAFLPQFEPLGNWRYPAAIPVGEGKPDEGLGYRNDITLCRRVRVAQTAEGEIDLGGSLYFQVCNDELCFPRKKRPLHAKFTVLAAAGT